MKTPWERIKDENYREWLSQRQIIADEYNTLNIVERSTLQSQYVSEQVSLNLCL